MNTAFILLAQYGARAVIPLDVVARDYFPHLQCGKLLAKINAGDIALPVIRMDVGSQKSSKGVTVQALAQYIDERAAAAKKECAQLTGADRE